jgi:hypothetical protein
MPTTGAPAQGILHSTAEEDAMLLDHLRKALGSYGPDATANDYLRNDERRPLGRPRTRPSIDALDALSRLERAPAWINPALVLTTARAVSGV